MIGLVTLRVNLCSDAPRTELCAGQQLQQPTERDSQQSPPPPPPPMYTTHAAQVGITSVSPCFLAQAHLLDLGQPQTQLQAQPCARYPRTVRSPPRQPPPCSAAASTGRPVGPVYRWGAAVVGDRLTYSRTLTSLVLDCSQP